MNLTENAIHLRSIHFWLIVSCVTVVILAQIPSNLDIAIKDLGNIEAVQGEIWGVIEERGTPLDSTVRAHMDDSEARFKRDMFGSYIDDTINLYIREHPTERIIYSDLIEIRYNKDELSTGLRSGVYEVHGKWSLSPRVEPLFYGVGGEGVRWALKDFADLWTALNEPHFVYVPVEYQGKPQKPPSWSAHNKAEPYEVMVSAPKEPPLDSDIINEVRVGGVSHVDNLSPRIAFYSPEWMRGKLSLPAQRIQLDLQRAIREFLGTDWKEGSFDDTFPILSGISKELDHLNLWDLTVVVRNLREAGGGSLKIFGMEFPRSLITDWGILLVLVVQLYFSIHFHEFASKIQKNDEIWHFPWLIMYTGKIPTITSVITIVALPVTCAIISAYIGFSSTYLALDRLGYFLIFGMVVAVSLYTTKSYLRLKGRAGVVTST